MKAIRREDIHTLIAGEAARDPDTGIYYARTPNGLIANLRAHEVIEHQDGTITVSPSIEVVRPGATGYHGYLERGLWREAK